MQNDTLNDIAAALVAARRSGIAADETPWKDTALTSQDINTVQERVAAELGWADAPDAPGAWKGGGPTPTSVAAFARLPPVWVRPSPGRLAVADFHRLGIEIEVAFRLARDVSAVDLAARAVHDPVALFDAMAVSIELVDYRWQGGEHAPAPLRMADLQSNGALVLGDWRPMQAIDWQQQVATLTVDGVQVGRYQGAHPCGDPMWMAPQWLQHGVARHDRLPAGSVLTTGSWCGMVWLEGPAVVHAAFEEIGEATLTLV
ncbi:fumarylacetoacetate hydrolase family protein [Variovorax boronicumulans]|uniref:fumarylacetoacetate hydrolase family protein n=1 Tax=Variovorax boronicumulans TaxID=436515 RepID=UPI001C588ADE